MSGAGILRPLIDDLNARAAMSPFDKATAARVACNARDTPNWGAGPVVTMPNGDLIVTPRMVAKEGLVLIVKPDGAVLRGTAGIVCSRDDVCHLERDRREMARQGNLGRPIGMKCRREPGAVGGSGREWRATADEEGTIASP